MLYPLSFTRIVKMLIYHRTQADKMDALETQHGWREEDFDFVLQFLRTILMKRRIDPLDKLLAITIPESL